MKKIRIVVGLILWLQLLSSVNGDSFHNLSFESVRQPLVPDPSDPFMRVPITDALPFWQGFVGGVEQTSVFYTTRTAGAASLALVSTDLGFPSLEGKYSVLLGSSPMSDVTITQFGHIPDDARSLRLLGLPGYAGPGSAPLDTIFGVSINGQPLAFTDTFFVPGSHTYSADVSGFAGTDATLSLTAFHAMYADGFTVDAISFSPVVVPEPSTLLVFGLASVLGWVFYRPKGRRGLRWFLVSWRCSTHG